MTEEKGIKYKAEFLDSARRKKQKDGDNEGEEIIDGHAKKVGLRRLV